MNQQPHQNAMGDILMRKDIFGIPTACRYENLCSNDMHRIHNENVNWLTEGHDRLPLWSRLKTTNCSGHPRKIMLSKNKDYEIEIPGRLLSIFGNTDQQTKLMNNIKDMDNCHLVGNILALCAALKYNFQEWSVDLLDSIATKATQLYPELLKKLSISDKEFKTNHLTQLFQLDDGDFQVQLQHVALGYLYIRYGLNEFNLARALKWFFHNYQFGLIKCNNRSLAFGFTPDTDYGFFMYDCQCRGFPLLEELQANSYILRTHHLQILLYCLIISLNVSKEMVKFSMYNVDIRIVNPLEISTLKKEIYVPTIMRPMKKEVKKKVDCGTVQRKFNKKAPPANTSGKCSKNNSIINVSAKKTLKSCTSLTPRSSYKSNTNTKPKTSKSENLKPQISHRQMSFDPNKEYYIIAVPKKSTSILTTTENKECPNSKVENNRKLEKSAEETIKNVKVNIHRINTLNPQETGNQANSNFVQGSESETIYLNKSASTVTLTPESVNDNASKIVNPMGLNVYLVDNSNNQNKIKVAQHLNYLLTK